MSRKWKSVLPGFICVIALLLSSCGTPYHGTTGGTPILTPTAAATAHPTEAGSGAPAQTPPVQKTAIPGKVVVTIGKPSYAINEDITATIINGLSSSLEAMDHQSACTLLVLQQQVGNTWKNLASCRLMTATRRIQIQAQTSLQQKLSPPGGSWSAGQYRLMLRYTPGVANTESRQNTNASTLVYSADFVIA